MLYLCGTKGEGYIDLYSPVANLEALPKEVGGNTKGLRGGGMFRHLEREFSSMVSSNIVSFR